MPSASPKISEAARAISRVLPASAVDVAGEGLPERLARVAYAVFKEQVLSEEAVEAGVQAAFVPPISADRRTDMRAAFRAALATLDVEEGEERG